MEKRETLYEKLFSLYVKAYPQTSKQKSQSECNEYWNGIKSKTNFKEKYNVKKNELENIIKNRKISSFFLPKATTSVISVLKEVLSPVCSSSAASASSSITVDSNNHCLVQQKLQQELNIINADLIGLLARESANMITDDQTREIIKKKAEKRQIEKEIGKKKADQLRQKKCRLAKKQLMEKACVEYPELSSKLKIKEKVGRPPITEEQPELLKSILDIAIFGSSADERRRIEGLRSIKTLDELHRELLNLGFKISRSAVYYHLLPKYSKTIDGKRHIRTVPVKLIRATNDLHKEHTDTHFATSTILHLNELASFLGPHDVAILSQDDKYRVPIGITAAKSQAPMLMNMEYRIKLPDHDWVVGDRHKLIPSVYAGIIISEKGYGGKESVSSSGPTFIAIRSGKHSSSTAFSHAKDFERLMQLKEFNALTKMPDLQAKPIFIFLVDGGPDENPRYPKTINSAINHFHRYNLDALFIATNAPGRSAFNPVERRMAPLSRELCGVILPHDHFGTHLDDNAKTIDLNLEKLNFQYAGETLASIFSGVVIDSHPIVAEFVTPDESEIDPTTFLSVNEKWKMIHVRSSQYCLQIAKCNNNSCCSEPRSNFLKFFPDRFLPSPISLSYNPRLRVADPEDSGGNFMNLFQNLVFGDKAIPYDTYCPSINKSILSRVCVDCNLYCASLEMLKTHRKEIHNRIVNTKKKPKKIISKRDQEFLIEINDDIELTNVEHVDVDCFEITSPTIDENIPIIDVETHLKSLWEFQLN